MERLDKRGESFPGQHERFILGIENVLQQIVLQQTANP
jgi:hypothetical protein